MHGGTRRAAPRERVVAKAGRSVSSKRWLARQLNDDYVAAARAAGYRSRAAYKLIELDQRFKLLRPGARVVDLGTAPGGWTQVAVERAGPGAVVGIDLIAVDPIAGARLLVGDIEADDAVEAIMSALGGPADIVLSDVAPRTTGHRPTDALRSAALCEAAAVCAAAVLAPRGWFVGKLLRGAGEAELLAALRRDYNRVRHAKPPASRAESNEIYLVADGFRGTDPA